MVRPASSAVTRGQADGLQRACLALVSYATSVHLLALTLARPNARALLVCLDRRNPYTAKTVMTLTGHPCSVKAVAFNERFSQVGRSGLRGREY